MDVWTWAVRIYPTRSAASAACKAGHVRVNGTRAKPAHALKVGDTVRARTAARERVVVVTGLLGTRVGAALAAENYQDHSPALPPRETAPALIVRERGSGRPTKQDRRRMERLRGRD